MTALETPPAIAGEKTAQVATLLRLLGAVFILAGVVLGLDTGGVATTLGLNDGTSDSLHQIFGGLLVLVGLVDFFVLPVFLKRLAGKRADTP